MLTVVVGVVLGLSCLLYFLQDNLIFFPQPMTMQEYAAVRRESPSATEVDVAGADGVHVRGWFLRSSSPDAGPLIIYFGGNAEENSWVLPLRSRFDGWSLLLVDYRGYGRSDGTPSEAALYQDALTLYDRFSMRPDVDRRRIVAMGRSLGSGVAVYLASMRPVGAVILITPFDSVTRVAQKHFPFLPMRWLIRHRFDSVSRAPLLKVPALFLAAAQDRTVPPSHARALFDAWGGPKEWHLIPNANHDTIMESDEHWRWIRAFLAERYQGK